MKKFQVWSCDLEKALILETVSGGAKQYLYGGLSLVSEDTCLILFFFQFFKFKNQIFQILLILPIIMHVIPDFSPFRSSS